MDLKRSSSTRSSRSKITTIEFFSLIFIFIGHVNTNVNHVFGFQVPSDPNNAYKKAIETTTKQRVVERSKTKINRDSDRRGRGLPFVPFDDKTYSPGLPSSFSSSQSPFPNDEMIQCRHDKNKNDKNKPFAALPLSKSGVTDRLISPHRNAVARRRFGYDDMPSEYWFDNRIHSLGNIGPFGGLHAAVAPLATKLIDNSAYDGEDVRTRVSLVSFLFIL